MGAAAGARATKAPHARVAKGPRARRLYAPAPTSGALRQAAELRLAGRLAEAAGVLAMARTPRAVWLTGGSPAATERRVRAVMRAATRQRAVPALVLYDVPGRDCARYSAGGAADGTRYRAWIDAVARALGGGPALVVLEPDSLALLPSECAGTRAAEAGPAEARTAARYRDLSYAVGALAGRHGTRVYLDAGHPAWHSVRDIVPRLVRAGAGRAAGFSLNVANFQPDEAVTWYGSLVSSCLGYAARGGDPADCPDQGTPHDRARAWLAAHVPAKPSALPHFVADTGRNGQGPWSASRAGSPAPEDWCNPPGRGLGARPTLRTGDPLEDARLWIKVPGESDGGCLRGTQGPADPRRGTPDPPAGAWFSEMALELIRGARPPVLGGV
ncbi:glycoside hydrolase family 6 protein [Streptomyces sp. TS71-3]|uniref:glycoside hydrolase family 6 protein n=1 Tax=Streptomyces sp. TS71-3 TaxID=2733862 RepID=UPI001BB454DE|nr:glycoside hydrolase family 6 protein [Streptomyces sp. TS71-3]